jgi:hypothetical protein
MTDSYFDLTALASRLAGSGSFTAAIRDWLGHPVAYRCTSHAAGTASPAEARLLGVAPGAAVVRREGTFGMAEAGGTRIVARVCSTIVAQRLSPQDAAKLAGSKHVGLGELMRGRDMRRDNYMLAQTPGGERGRSLKVAARLTVRGEALALVTETVYQQPHGAMENSAGSTAGEVAA